MAKYERSFQGNFNQVLDLCEEAIMKGSVTASYEEGSDYENAGVEVAVRGYERYSAFGGNRVSLNLTLMGYNGDIFLSAITSGGSQAMFFKINTIGEENFLGTLTSVVDKYISG